MPWTKGTVKKPELPVKQDASDETEAIEAESEESEQGSDKAAIMQRLKAQGAVKVFPTAGGESSSSGTGPSPQGPVAQAPEKESAEESETEEAESEDAIREKRQAAHETEQQAFLERTNKQIEKANNPSWYNLPQHVHNARHGKWDLNQKRTRSGGREQDLNLEEDVRTHIHTGKMDPGMFDVRQKAKNAWEEVSNNKVATAAGMVPIVGGVAKQVMMERDDVHERDLLRGVAATSHTDESVKGKATEQADALRTKITGGRVKAGIGVVTGVVGKAVPGAGNISSAAGTVAKLAVDQATKGANKKVISARAREKARQDMGKEEFGEYEGVEDYIALEKMRKQLEKAGDGNEDSGAASMIAPDMLNRLKAHTRGQIPNAKLFKNRAKEFEKEREAERQKGMEPKPGQEGDGMLSKIKGFFRRSS